MLKVTDLRAGYGQLEVLHGINLSVDEGEAVAFIGSNAAGKTTTLNTLSGVLAAKSGSIWFQNEDLTKLSSHARVERGLVLVPQGRQLFDQMSIGENLQLGAFTRRAAGQATRTLSEVFDLFPVLADRRRQQAGTLSGGEQSMLAIARGLMALPTLLMLDEPSEGLSPLLVTQIMDLVGSLAARGVTVLLVEQNVGQALRRTRRGYVLESGRITMNGDSRELLADKNLRAAFLGL
jgi:branched-chain amino acid transport system ATP-binding protein